MKYLKKFERLNINTYINAGKELSKLGHTDRGENLRNFAIKRAKNPRS